MTKTCSLSVETKQNKKINRHSGHCKILKVAWLALKFKPHLLQRFGGEHNRHMAFHISQHSEKKIHCREYNNHAIEP
ncbi:hypothetical protein Hanom_Chr06g00507011 [Helianthus anomalus]